MDSNSGFITGYISPQSMIVVAVVPTSLSIIAVALRFHIRRGQKVPLAWDDWLLVPSLILLVGMALTLLVGVGLGAVGYDIGLAPGAVSSGDVVNDRVLTAQKVRPAVQTLQTVALGLVKASFIMLYRRIFCWGARDWFWKISLGYLIGDIVWTIAFFLVNMFYCGTHFSKQWSSFNEQAVFCPNAITLQLAFAVSDFATDILVILLPVPAILHLNMTIGKRFLILGVFLMGVIAVAASGIRMTIVALIFNMGLRVDVDPDLGAACLLFWGMVEVGVAIIAACLPILRVLFRLGIFSRLADSEPVSRPSCVATVQASSGPQLDRGRRDFPWDELALTEYRGRHVQRTALGTKVGRIDLEEGGIG